MIICGDCREFINKIDKTINLVITSPPYLWQRDYKTGSSNEIGKEKTEKEYVDNLLEVFKLCTNILAKDGSIIFNLGDKFKAGYKLIPLRFAIAVLDNTDYVCANNIIWSKKNPEPKHMNLCKRLLPAHESLFHFVHKDYIYKYKFNFNEMVVKNEDVKIPGNNVGQKYIKLINESEILTIEQKNIAFKKIEETIKEIREGKIVGFRMKIKGIHSPSFGGQSGGRNKEINDKGFTIIKFMGNSYTTDVFNFSVDNKKNKFNFATYPKTLIYPLIKMFTDENDWVLDPFLGSGTTYDVCSELNRNCIGIELNQNYVNKQLSI